ncbi:MAG: site-specific integrase, partial [Bacteroidaceae bacterium]|nr:site-specific integrase [Bacteroidaceae bacterium]
MQISTKVHVGTRDWDSRKLHVKDSDIYASDKNLIIGNILARINDVLVKARLRNKMLTRQSFLKAYNRPSDYDTFFQ